MKARRLFRSLKWWFFHRFVPLHQYHIIRTSLRPGYYDPCMRLESAIFDVTKEFWDNTKHLIDWNSDKYHKEAAKVFQSATDFWNRSRKILQEGEVWGQEERDLRAQSEKHLLGILKNLDSMWYP